MYQGRKPSSPDSTTPEIYGQILPLLPLRDVVIFPDMVIPLFVGREKSIAALKEASASKRNIVLSAQRDARIDDPDQDDIYTVGCLCSIMQMLKMPDDTVKVLVEGLQRVRIKEFLPNDEYFLVFAEPITDPELGVMTVQAEALIRSVQTTFEQYVKLSKRIPQDMVMSISAIESPGKLADVIAGKLNLKIEDRQKLIETFDPTERLEKVLGMRGASRQSPRSPSGSRWIAPMSAANCI